MLFQIRTRPKIVQGKLLLQEYKNVIIQVSVITRKAFRATHFCSS